MLPEIQSMAYLTFGPSFFECLPGRLRGFTLTRGWEGALTFAIGPPNAKSPPADFSGRAHNRVATCHADVSLPENVHGRQASSTADIFQ
jgi:hypothetical protein